VEALRRAQALAGAIRIAESDRNPNRAAQLQAISEELFQTALAALDGGPLPPNPGAWKDAR
jgi:hypothetical protein